MAMFITLSTGVILTNARSAQDEFIAKDMVEYQEEL